jgi:hypothetical protein
MKGCVEMNDYIGEIVHMKGYYIPADKMDWKVIDFSGYVGYTQDGSRVYSAKDENKITKEGFYKIDKVLYVNENKRNIYAKLSNVYAYDLYNSIGLKEFLEVMKKFNFEFVTYDFFGHTFDKKTSQEKKVFAWNDETGILISADTFDNKTRFNNIDVTTPIFCDMQTSFEESFVDCWGLSSINGDSNIQFDAVHAQCDEWLKCMIKVVKSSGDMKNYKTDFTYKNYTQRYTDVTVSFNDFPVSLQSFLNKYRFEP